MINALIKELEDRKSALIKGRDQLQANIHATNGAIAELVRLIEMFNKEDEDLDDWINQTGGAKEN